MNDNIKVIDAEVNNLKKICVEVEFGKLMVCAGPSGSGKSSFAFDTLIKKQSCIIENYPKMVKYVSQRISNTGEKLKQVLSLKGVENSLIVIDEPLAGTTHEEALKYARFIKELASNNAVVIVEHRKEIFEFADIVLVFGPKSGQMGGEIVKITSGREYLKSLLSVVVDRIQNKSNKRISATFSEFEGFKDYNVELFLNTITAVTGSIESDKSIYLDALFKAFDKSVGASERRENLIEVKNKNYIRRPHIIDASPVTKNSRSTVATYYGMSKLFKDKNLNITVREAMDIYKYDILIIRRLEYLKDIGLDYLKLNQSSFSLSGGECQRIKLAKLLCKKLGDRSIYIFDNPVRGLGEKNIVPIMMMFDKLVKNNNTVLIAENDPTALKFVDKIISRD